MHNGLSLRGYAGPASLFLMAKLTYLMTDPSTYLINSVFTMQAMQDIRDVSTTEDLKEQDLTS